MSMTAARQGQHRGAVLRCRADQYGRGESCARHVHPTAARAAATGSSTGSRHYGPARGHTHAPICRVSPSCSATPLTPITTGAWLQQGAVGAARAGEGTPMTGRSGGTTGRWGQHWQMPGYSTAEAGRAVTSGGSCTAASHKCIGGRQCSAPQSPHPKSTRACLPKLRRANVTRPNSPWLPSRSSISRLMMLQWQWQWPGRGQGKGSRQHALEKTRHQQTIANACTHRQALAGVSGGGNLHSGMQRREVASSGSART